jgi:hypothetical protein
MIDDGTWQTGWLGKPYRSAQRSQLFERMLADALKSPIPLATAA